jgi:hypothetical protein
LGTGSVAVRNLILVGSANGGSLRTLKELNRGRRYLEPFGRWFSPEVLFTFPSLFEDLPAYRGDLFVDEDGSPLDVDLYDAASWSRFGWSVFGQGAAGRLAAGRHSRIFSDSQSRRLFLQERLLGARRFQEVLQQDPGPYSTRIYMVQNSAEPTAEQAVLESGQPGWATLFTGDEGLRRRRSLLKQVSAPGDGHATRRSQMHLSPVERRFLAQPTVEVQGSHFGIILAPETRRQLLEWVSP